MKRLAALTFFLFATAALALPAPTNFRAVVRGNPSVQFYWDAVPGEVFFVTFD